MDLYLIHKDQWSLYEVEGNLLDFLESLADNHQKMVEGLFPLLERIAEAPTGPRSLNRKICHQIEEGIWQISKGKIRVLWFYDDSRLIICAHAFLKKTPKTPKQELRRAIRIKKAYFRDKQRGCLNWHDE